MERKKEILTYPMDKPWETLNEQTVKAVDENNIWKRRFNLLFDICYAAKFCPGNKECFDKLRCYSCMKKNLDDKAKTVEIYE